MTNPAGLTFDGKEFDNLDPKGADTSNSSTPRFTLIDDFAIEEEPQLEWTVDRMLPAGGFWVLVGLPGVAKTFLALLLAFLIALGRSFHSRKVQRGSIVYVAAEGRGGLATRVRVLKRWLEVAGHCGVYFITEAVQLRSVEDVAALLEVTAKLPQPPVAFVFDTWPRCTTGSEENSAKEIGEAIASVDYIRQRTGAAVFALHHTDKNGLRERGSSALRGACDAMLIAARDDDLVTVSCEKMKEAEAFDPIHFRLKVIELETGETSCVLEATDSAIHQTPPPPGARLPATRQLALEALRGFGAPGATYSQWFKVFGKAESTFQRCVRDLTQWNRVTQTGSHYFPAGNGT